MSAGDESGYSPLQQFDCVAIPAPGVELRAVPSTWHAGNPVLQIHDVTASPSQGDNDIRQSDIRQSQLNQLDCERLRELVERNANQLSTEELLLIQRIAQERAIQFGPGDREAATRLEAIVARIVEGRPH